MTYDLWRIELNIAVRQINVRLTLIFLLYDCLIIVVKKRIRCNLRQFAINYIYFVSTLESFIVTHNAFYRSQGQPT